jgi:hypothetical protein
MQYIKYVAKCRRKNSIAKSNHSVSQFCLGEFLKEICLPGHFLSGTKCQYQEEDWEKEQVPNIC